MYTLIVDANSLSLALIMLGRRGGLVVRVPVSNLIGEEGRGFAIMMSELPRERLTIAARLTCSAPYIAHLVPAIDAAGVVAALQAADRIGRGFEMAA